jgi:uncharacterized protein
MPIEREVPCPGCRRLCLYGAGNRWRPFCSQRCAGVDLGAWASEAFRVPAVEPADDDETPPPAAH